MAVWRHKQCMIFFHSVKLVLLLLLQTAPWVLLDLQKTYSVGFVLYFPHWFLEGFSSLQCIFLWRAQKVLPVSEEILEMVLVLLAAYTFPGREGTHLLSLSSWAGLRAQESVTFWLWPEHQFGITNSSVGVYCKLIIITLLITITYKRWGNMHFTEAFGS